MQVAATLPATGVHFFQTRRASFKCNGYSSPLNPITRTTSTVNAQSLKTISPPPVAPTPTEITKKHLANLEKLLQKESKPEPVKTEENRGRHRKTEENRGRNLLEGLNLSRIWPEMKAAEEMSPRHLIRLHRMLSSKSMEYSPRNNLGTRWKEYHGCKDWLGLLDPLDENLRRELVRYGEFIQAAYHCFHSDPATSADENPGVARNVSLPDRSYKVTKSLYATSSIGLPKWVDDVAPDLGWMTQRSSWIGYVAVCDDKAEIQRMGRRDIVIALRGTATCLEWGENLRDLLVQMPGENESTEGQPKVECGFLSLYKTGGAKIPSLAESVVNEVRRLTETYKGESLSITVTGHSLGAALALLVADDISTCTQDAPPVAVFSFGGPRVGNKGFANRIESKNVKVLRIVNKQDVITKVPGMFVSEAIDKKLRETGASGVLNLLDNSMPWAYSHVGTELRVDTTKSPFLKPDADVACCHDLEAYLHLVDGYLGSNESFRPNAKRSLAKLLNEQSANIKKLYTSKGKDLSSLNLNREFSFPRPSCLPSPSVLPSPSS
ncbi:Phospholipase A1-Ibeta2, chloroplastic [Capsicum annuum]|uniref:Phospholipase A1-Ibeta2, chloroplastic n=1 Tax=Capsicum annuum TaxID=4072 RepID=A0A2G3AF51_CAPAN|nr:phospholipase A1-Ibeta2, chloroplastic [Capsicum annuum]KAF3649341.1 Phospholipase A1-Ibeta2, chloroplastic [Capsicum annuum]PHT92840.1 Phospholipase A1-Ibeta2, chloroplastic [Capsicum annuum]